MTETNTKTQPSDLDEAIRKRVIERAMAINTKLLARFATVADDLEVGGYRGALGGLDGLERDIGTMRSFLLLLPWEPSSFTTNPFVQRRTYERTENRSGYDTGCNIYLQPQGLDQENPG